MTSEHTQHQARALVADHLVNVWSGHGVEVVSSGSHTTTITLPARFEDVGALTDDLWATFGATVALEYDNLCLKGEITVDRHMTHKHNQPTYQQQSSSNGSLLFYTIFVFILAIAVGLRRDSIKDDTQSILVYLLSLL
jgi:hypothetical protein